MKRVMIVIIFLSLFNVVCAPPFVCGVIVRPEAIKVFDPILYAFQKVESNFKTDIVNHLGYTGILQEGPEMIAEANRINKMTGNPRRYTFPESALDSTSSVNIWYDVQNYWNPKYNVKRAAHIWNPKASSKYYLKLQKQLRHGKTKI